LLEGEPLIFLSFAEALRLAQQSQAMGFCSGIVNNSSQANPQQPQYPQQSQQSACQIMPGRDAYGRNFYRLVDRQGRMVLNTANYSVAMQTVQTDVRCRLY